MDNAGNDFLTYAGFSVDNDIGGVSGYLKSLAQRSLGFPAAENISADIAFHALVFLPQLLNGFAVGLGFTGALELTQDGRLHLGEFAQQRQGIGGVTLDKACIRDHIDLFSDAFGGQGYKFVVAAEGGKIDFSAVFCGYKAGCFCVGGVDTIDDHIEALLDVMAAGAAEKCGVCSICHQDLVKQIVFFQMGATLLVTYDTDQMTVISHFIPGGVAAHQADAAAGTHYQYGLPGLDGLIGARRRAGFVHGGNSCPQRQILRCFDDGRTGVQNGLPFHIKLRAFIVYPQDPINPQRGYRQGDKRNNGIFRLDIVLIWVLRPKLCHAAVQHSAGVGYRVMQLAALLDDLQNAAAHERLVAACFFPDFVKADQVDADDFDVDQKLIRAQGHGIVDFPGLLSQGMTGFNGTPQPKGVQHSVTSRLSNEQEKRGGALPRAPPKGIPD